MYYKECKLPCQVLRGKGRNNPSITSRHCRIEVQCYKLQVFKAAACTIIIIIIIIIILIKQLYCESENPYVGRTRFFGVVPQLNVLLLGVRLKWQPLVRTNQTHSTQHVFTEPGHQALHAGGQGGQQPPVHEEVPLPRPAG